MFVGSFTNFYDKDKSKLSNNEYYTNILIEILKDINKNFIKLSNNAKNSESIQNVYRFNSKADISKFIITILDLSDQHGKYAWLYKGLILAHREWTIKKMYDNNKHLSKYPYYYTLMYGLWWCKGKIPMRKCLLKKKII